MTYLIGLDLGQSSDPTAKVFLERSTRKTREERGRGDLFENYYLLSRIERPQLMTPYDRIVDGLHAQMKNPILAGADLIVDATGVGRPVVDMMRAKGMSPIPVTITGGSQTTQVNGSWRVPKKDLVNALQLAIQTERLRVLSGLALREVFEREAAMFKVKITSSANETYEAWRERDHDDVVLAVALAVWWGEKTGDAGWRLNTSGEEARREQRRKAYLEKRDMPFWKRGRRDN